MAQRDGLKAGFESFKAMDCGKTNMSQDEARLEAGFKATRGRLRSRSRASAIETEKMVKIRGPFLTLKMEKKAGT